MERFAGLSRREIKAMIGPAFFQDPQQALKEVAKAYAERGKTLPQSWDDEVEKLYGYVSDELKEEIREAAGRKESFFEIAKKFTSRLVKGIKNKIAKADTETKVSAVLGLLALGVSVVAPDLADDVVQPQVVDYITNVVKSVFPGR